jgi:bifunctional non-homologous end joining protein LigD
VRSRPGRDCSRQFPELASLAEALAAHRVIVDGELVHFAADGAPTSRACAVG